MLPLKCTKRLLNFLSVDPTPLPDQASDTLIGPWHVGLADYGTHRILISVNDRSLYCLIDVIPEYSSTVNLPMIVRHSLLRTLMRHVIDQPQIERISGEYSHHLITKTDNRHVIGILNDIDGEVDYRMGKAIDDGIAVDLQLIEDEINLSPRKYLGWQSPVRIFTELLLNG